MYPQHLPSDPAAEPLLLSRLQNALKESDAAAVLAGMQDYVANLPTVNLKRTFDRKLAQTCVDLAQRAGTGLCTFDTVLGIAHRFLFVVFAMLS